MKSYLWSKKKATKNGSKDGVKLADRRLTAGYRYSSGTLHAAYDIASPYDYKTKRGMRLRAHRKMKVLALNDGVKNPPYASPGSNKPSNWVLLGVKMGKNKKKQTLYLQHLSPGLKVKVGQILEPGDLIGFAGITGNTTGPHLHVAAMHGWRDSASQRYDYLNKPSTRVYPLDNILRVNKNRKDGW